MSRPVPLVRAAALAPFILWMRAHGRGWEYRLRAAGVPAIAALEPDRPIALVAGVRFIRDAARAEGPDLSSRVVSAASILQLASFGRYALGARTPRGAFERLTRAFACHSSHERFVVTPSASGAVVRHTFDAAFDDESLHACQQYVAAMIRSAFAGTAGGPHPLTAVSIVPHPTAGVRHLDGVLAPKVTPAEGRTLSVSLSATALDQPYLRPGRDRDLPLDLKPIRDDGSLTTSLRAILPAMLEEKRPDLEEIADLAGTSRRTFQRRLADEGATLSGLIDDIRRDQAVARLSNGREPVASISAELGYSDQSCLTRAMRRWTNAPPTRIRHG